MLVFDAYPLAAVLLGEPAGEPVARLLSSSLEAARLGAINAAEVVDLVARARAVEPGQVSAAIDLWAEGGLRVVALDWPRAQRAAELRATNYHRTRSPVSLADCAAVALAEHLGATLVTSDGPMLRIARSVGADIHAVADSTGSIPTG